MHGKEEADPALGQLLGEVERAVAAGFGLHLPRWVLLARTTERAAALGLPLVDHLRHLRALAARFMAGERSRAEAADEPELSCLTEALRVGETRFFRHAALWAALRDVVLPERLAAARAEVRPVRLWSAGCATGEEAWSLAMLAARASHGAARSAGPPEVFGTDLSQAALLRAEAGRYPKEAALEVPRDLQGRYLHTNGEAVIAQALREACCVRFRRHNLLGPGYISGCDVILCCNVLIYFDAREKRQVLGHLQGSLRDGGYLLVGAAESLRAHGELFEARVHVTAEGEWSVYRRRSSLLSQPPARPSRSPSRSPPPRGRLSSKMPSRPSTASGRHRSSRPRTAPPGAPPLATLRLSGSYGDGRRLHEELRPLLSGVPVTVNLDGAGYLDDGDARVLLRASHLTALRLLCRRPSVHRWLRRHHLHHLLGPGPGPGDDER